MEGGNGEFVVGGIGVGALTGGGIFIGGIENPEFPSSICAIPTVEKSIVNNRKKYLIILMPKSQMKTIVLQIWYVRIQESFLQLKNKSRFRKYHY